MNRLIRVRALLLLLLLLACTPVTRAPAAPGGGSLEVQMGNEPVQDSLTPALTMTIGRAAHSATLLPGGKVLIAGGFRVEGRREIAIASAELFDPATNGFASTGEMKEARSGHTATLLPDGKVLIVGGWGPSQRQASAEIYDPQTGQFRFAASLPEARGGMTATLLKDGRVLIAGGSSGGNKAVVVAQLYEPKAGRFVATGALHNERSAHTATRLKDGNVLIVGGSAAHNRVLNSAEIYDVTTGKFVPTGELKMVRHKHAAVLLQDGNVLVAGGSNQEDWKGQYASTEVYDVATGDFRQGANMHNERFKLADAALLLTGGDVLIGGGNRLLERFDAQRQRFIKRQQLDDDYYFAVLTRLQNGSVLITGGYDRMIQPTDQAWIYR